MIGLSVMRGGGPRLAVALCGALISLPLSSATFSDPNGVCMIPAERIGTVTSRFGISRGTSGSHPKPYQHDGLDFRTRGAVPLYASADGIVTALGARGNAGNALLIKRPSGEVYGYYHLSGFMPGLRVGSPVKAGQQVGFSGNTNAGSSTSGNFLHHLHVVYGVPSASAQRAAGFKSSGEAKPFSLGTLPSAFTNKAIDTLAYRTDPSPYFCQTFPIDDGNPSLKPVLGADTKAQFEILNGKLPPSVGSPNASYDTAQTQAANEQVANAQAQGKELLDTLSDADGFGALPTAPIGAYATMSTQEMMLTEASRRFSDASWNAEIAEVSSRALYLDLLAARGVSNYLLEATYRKRERIEALMATYTSLRLKGQRESTRQAQQQISQTWLQRLIN